MVNHNPNMRISDATAVTFSIKCFNPLKFKTLSSVGKHLQKVVCFILFIYFRAFNNNVISNGKSYCVTILLLTSGLHRLHSGLAVTFVT